MTRAQRGTIPCARLLCGKCPVGERRSPIIPLPIPPRRRGSKRQIRMRIAKMMRKNLLPLPSHPRRRGCRRVPTEAASPMATIRRMSDGRWGMVSLEASVRNAHRSPSPLSSEWMPSPGYKAESTHEIGTSNTCKTRNTMHAAAEMRRYREVLLFFIGQKVVEIDDMKL